MRRLSSGQSDDREQKLQLLTKKQQNQVACLWRRGTNFSMLNWPSDINLCMPLKASFIDNACLPGEIHQEFMNEGDTCAAPTWGVVLLTGWKCAFDLFFLLLAVLGLQFSFIGCSRRGILNKKVDPQPVRADSCFPYAGTMIRWKFRFSVDILWISPWLAIHSHGQFSPGICLD